MKIFIRDSSNVSIKVEPCTRQKFGPQKTSHNNIPCHVGTDIWAMYVPAIITLDPPPPSPHWPQYIPFHVDL